MAFIEIPRGYNNGEALLEIDLDAIQLALTTFFNTAKIADDVIQTNGITASDKFINGTVTAAEIGLSAVTSAKIATGQVTTAKIADLAVTAAKIEALAVTTAKIPDNNITTALINTSAVTTEKIADANVTQVKRGNFATLYTATLTAGQISSASYATMLTTTYTQDTANRPVRIEIGAADDNSQSYIYLSNSANTVAPALDLQLQASSDGGTNYTTFWEVKYRLDCGAASGNGKFPIGGLWALHIPTSAGTWTYRLRGKGYNDEAPATAVASALVSARLAIYGLL